MTLLNKTDLDELMDYINHLDDTVGLTYSTLINIESAICKYKRENSIY